jgi:ERCC4-type nuclease
MESLEQRSGQTQPITVTADDRECDNAVVAELECRDGFTLVSDRLDCGDYLVDGRYLFERKTLTDLVLSIESGRLFAQALRLAEVKDTRPALVLEGTAAHLRHCRMHRESIHGALVTVSLFIGLPVLRSRCPRETVDTFRYVAHQGRSVARGALPRKGRRPRGKSAYQHYLLQGLPGIGPERARRLLAHFGSVRAVMAADPDELAAVAGIGDRIARRIDWALRETGADYRVVPAERQRAAGVGAGDAVEAVWRSGSGREA